MNNFTQTELNTNTLFLSNTIKLYKGKEAFDLVMKEELQADWDVLYHTCPWATVFQSRVFVTTWYQIYQNNSLPIVVTGFQNGKLTGLLTMAMGEDGLIVGAGESQAEYQCWLATENNETFIKQAIVEIRKSFPQTKIQFKYIPAKAPLAWLNTESFWKKHCLLRTFDQPLLKIDEEVISAELRKKNRREKVNRLKRLGELNFERITDIKQFAALFDQLALQYDFRKGAMYNRAFFGEGSFRKQFLLSLFKQGLLHVTVLKVNNEVIASNVSVAGKKWVHLQGLNTHSPFYAKHSPGILHFLMLGILLSKENVEVFDLTPGSDGYKDSLASDYAKVYTLTISDSYDQLKTKIKISFNAFAKKGVAKMGIKPQAIKGFKSNVYFFKEKIGNVKKRGPFTLMKGLVQECQSVETKEYRIDFQFASQPTGANVNCNDLSDLMSFEAKGTWQSRWAFLQEAMRRLEMGENAYTLSENGRLLACVWLSSPKSVLYNAKTQAATTEDTYAKLEGMYYHPVIKDRLQEFILGVAHSVSSSLAINALHFSVCKSDRRLSNTLEALGYKVFEQPTISA